MGEQDAILVIDHDPDSALLLSDFLEREGYAVAVARTGAEGLRLIRHHPFALVLVDLDLPDGDGARVMREAALGDTPPEIIAVTGRATLDSAIEAVESRSAGYILKPVDVARLGTIVARVFDRRRLAREARRSQQRLEVLHDVARRLAAVHDPEEVLTVIVNEAAGLLGAEAAGLRLLEGDDLVVGARTESAAGVMARPRLKVGESLSGVVVAAG